MMTNQEAIRLIRNLPTMCEFTDAYGEPIDSDAYYEAVDMAISALQAQDSSVDLFPDLTIVEKAEIRGYVKGQLDAINDLVAAGLIEREKAISILKDHDLDEAGKDTISRQAAIDVVSRGCQEFRGIFAECEKNLNELPSPCEFCKHNDISDDVACLRCAAERRTDEGD